MSRAEAHVTCGHCEGTGTCRNGAHNNSCGTCLNKDGWRNAYNSEAYKDHRVKCSICNGTGWIKLSSSD